MYLGENTRLSTLLWLCYCWAQDSFAGAGVGTYLQGMSSEVKLQVHLIQGSGLALVITEHVKKCTQEMSVKLWQQSINVHIASARYGELGFNFRFLKNERIINKTEKCVREGTTGDGKLRP